MPSADLIDDLESGRLGLFVGSGFSRQLGLPTWWGLIEHMGVELGYDPDIFENLGQYMELAEFYEREVGNLDTLVAWMRKHWRDEPRDVKVSEVHRIIAQMKLPVIYTTNYDPWLEEAHRVHGVGYHRVVTGADFADAPPDTTEIVKFHGDLDVEDTLVVTQGHYFKRLQFEDALDLKLRADMLSYSLLFLGYSLSDINIRLMLHRLALIRSSLPKSARPLRSYVLQHQQNPVQRSILEQWNVEVLYLKDLDPGPGLVSFLQGLEKRDIASLLLNP
jgi:hypothetical protein